VSGVPLRIAAADDMKKALDGAGITPNSWAGHHRGDWHVTRPGKPQRQPENAAGGWFHSEPIRRVMMIMTSVATAAGSNANSNGTFLLV